MTEKLLVSIDEAASALSISKWTVRKYVDAGSIQTVRIGTRRLIAAAELERLAMEGLATLPPAAA
jgi:excisionase family DNA binding protein